MNPRILVFLFLLNGCTPDPAQLAVSLAQPATATAQYFHGNCLAGFSVGADLRIQETKGIGVVLSRLSYRVTDRGTGQVLSDESLDLRALEERYGERASVIPPSAGKNFHLGATSSDRPGGPLVVTGEIQAMDENDQTLVATLELSAPLLVNDPGPPSGGACTTP